MSWTGGDNALMASVEMVVMVMVVMVVVWVFVMVVLYKSFTTTIRQKTYMDKKTNTPHQQNIQLLLGCLNSTTHTTTPIKPTTIPTKTTTPPPPSSRSYFGVKNQRVDISSEFNLTLTLSNPSCKSYPIFDLKCIKIGKKCRYNIWSIGFREFINLFSYFS